MCLAALVLFSCAVGKSLKHGNLDVLFLVIGSWICGALHMWLGAAESKDEDEPESDPEPPDDWHTYHARGCGVNYRGCAPECPKRQYEETGVWPLR